MKKDKNWGDILPWLIIVWILNFIALMACLWGGSWLINNGVNWIVEPRDYCIYMFSVTKIFNTILVINSLSTKYGDGED